MPERRRLGLGPAPGCGSGRELLDAAIAHVRHVDKALAVHGDAAGKALGASAAAKVELAVAAALAAPLGDVVALYIEDLDACVAGVEDVDEIVRAE